MYRKDRLSMYDKTDMYRKVPLSMCVYNQSLSFQKEVDFMFMYI